MDPWMRRLEAKRVGNLLKSSIPSFNKKDRGLSVVADPIY